MTSLTTPDKPALRSWLPGLFVLGAIWGCSFLFIGVGVRELHPMYVTLGRVAAGALTLLVVLLVRRERLPRSGRLWAHLTLLGGFGA
ncbi:MAG: EamA family transporter, partial [Propionibacteriales bacterium]|nr:EamA family transporter [Propionibacteriales bacterium]